MEEPISRASLKTAAAAARTAAAPVFLDDTGRRARSLRAAASTGALAVVLGFAAVFAAVSGAPDIVSPLLPSTSDTSNVDASEQRPEPAATPTATPSITPAPAEPSVAPVVAPVVSDTPAPAPAPEPAPTPTAESADTPGNSGSAPGRSKAPTPPARP